MNLLWDVCIQDVMSFNYIADKGFNGLPVIYQEVFDPDYKPKNYDVARKK